MIDDELRALLSVEPQAGFEERVTARVKAERARAGWRGLRPEWLAIAATIVVALGTGLLPRTVPQSEAPRAVSPITRPTSPVGTALPRVTEQSSGAAQSAVAPRSRARRAPAVVKPTETDAAAPAAQIDRAESLALQRLFASHVDGVVIDVAPAAWTELVIPHIAIEPLTVDIRSEGASQ